MQKHCSKCGTLKPHSDFPYRSDRPSGVRPRCKVCESEAIRTLAQKNARINPYEAKRLKRCSRCKIEKRVRLFAVARGRLDGLQSVCKNCQHVFRIADREQAMNRRLKHSYGISLEDMKRLYDQQGGRCAICYEWRPMTGSTQDAIHVDHSHANGKVRALLCSNCNIGIGNMQDSSDLLQRAALYLESFG